MTLLLASSSAIRLQMLQAAAVPVTAHPVRIDEETIRDALLAEAAKPRDIADVLAEMKARKLAEKHPAALVLGCDQVLALSGDVLGKPPSIEVARSQLRALRGHTHHLLSAAVLYENGTPVWRHIGEARLTMRIFSDAYLEDYLGRNWPGIQSSVGAYKLEEEGARLFSRIDGDYFTILGLPLLPLLNHLVERGTIAS